LAIRGPAIPKGRVLDDFVLLPDLAATFLEAGGIERPKEMTAKSLMPVLKSEKGGQVDPERTWVITGRERHVESAREGFLPYPHRALRTKEYLYIINFEPDRWPMGDPYQLDGDSTPDLKSLADDTRITLKDMDASPTKAWLIGQRKDPKWKPYYDRAFAKRPREELFDLESDPHQVKNVAGDPAYAEEKKKLNKQLMDELTRTGDPRVTGDRQFFEKPPMAGPLVPARSGKP
jgi:arylsulfatase A-like enzyme